MKIEIQENNKEKDIENLKNLILTNKQYSEHPFANQKEQKSYVVEVADGNKKIVFFGSAHINKPENPLFTEIDEKFKETKPEIVFLEGMESINHNKKVVTEKLQKEDKEATKLVSEGYFALKLAVDAGIDFECPEPSGSSEVEYLLNSGFSKKDIFTFYIYRDIDQYQRQHKEWSKEECIEYLKPFFKMFHKNSGWDNNELTIFEQELIDTIDINNKTLYHYQVDPTPWNNTEQTIINEISRSSSSFRDRCIFEKIAEGLKKYERLFIVYGSKHAVTQEPAIRALLS